MFTLCADSLASEIPWADTRAPPRSLTAFDSTVRLHAMSVQVDTVPQAANVLALWPSRELIPDG